MHGVLGTRKKLLATLGLAFLALGCTGDTRLGFLHNNGVLVMGAVVHGLYAGSDQTCIIDQYGRVLCAGSRLSVIETYASGGRYVSNRSDFTLIPMPGEVPAKKIVQAEGFSCVLLVSGNVACWGVNATGGLAYAVPFGQAGQGPIGTAEVVLASKYDASTPSLISPLSGIKDLHGSLNGMCAVRYSGDLWCWGTNVFGELLLNPSAMPVQIPYTQSCQMNGLARPGFTCYLAVPLPRPAAWSNWAIVDSDGGRFFRCFVLRHTVTMAHRIDCVGNNREGQLGNTGALQTHLPLVVNSGVGWKWEGRLRSQSAGACAIAGNVSGTLETVMCWGNNANGEAGRKPGEFNCSATAPLRCPVGQVQLDGVGSNPLQGTRIDHFDVGSNFGCAQEGRRISCWGENSGLNLGPAGSTSSCGPGVYYGCNAEAVELQRLGPRDTVHALGLGHRHGCLVKSTQRGLPPKTSISFSMDCWGNNLSGQLGTGFQMIQQTVAKRTLSEQYSRLALGAAHVCGVAEATSPFTRNVASCWGIDTNGATGVELPNVVPARETPQRVRNTDHIEEISAGAFHTCGISRGPGSPKLICWGSALAGQTGQVGMVGHGDAREVPINLNQLGNQPLLSDLKYLSAGMFHTCVGVFYTVLVGSVRSAVRNRIMCFGENAFGSLGDNTWLTRHLPGIPVQRFDGRELGEAESQTITNDLTGIYSGSSSLHACATFRNSPDRMYCWGGNSASQVGEFAAFQQHPALAVNSPCDYGSNPRCRRAVPILGWSLGNEIVSVATGQGHTCALGIAQNDVRCWGGNNFGQLRMNNLFFNCGSVSYLVGHCHVPQFRPWGSLNPRIISRLIASHGSTCAIEENGAGLICWGASVHGHLGRAFPTNFFGIPDYAKTHLGRHFNGFHTEEIYLGGFSAAALTTMPSNDFHYWGSNQYRTHASATPRAFERLMVRATLNVLGFSPPTP